MITKPTVAVIIVNYNGKKYLPDCLSSLQNTKIDSVTFDTILVDNNSTDDSLQFVKDNYPEIKILSLNSNLGFAGGNNHGLKYAQDKGYEFVYLLNQDTIVNKNWLPPLLDIMQSNAMVGAVQSKLLLYPETGKINSLGNQLHYLGFGYAGGNYQLDYSDQSVADINYPSGAAVLIRTKVLSLIGLFDADYFMYHEDLDLGWRIWLAGFSCKIAPASVIFHKYEFSRSQQKIFYMERNRYITTLKNYKLATIIFLFPVWFLMEAGQWVYAILNGWWLQKLKSYIAMTDLVVWDKIIAAKQLQKKYRQLSDRQMLSKMTGLIQAQEISNPILEYLANPIFNFILKIYRVIIIW